MCDAGSGASSVNLSSSRWEDVLYAFFFFFFLLWKQRHREDVRAIQIHQQSHGYATFLPVHTGEFSIAAVPG